MSEANMTRSGKILIFHLPILLQKVAPLSQTRVLDRGVRHLVYATQVESWQRLGHYDVQCEKSNFLSVLLDILFSKSFTNKIAFFTLGVFIYS